MERKVKKDNEIWRKVTELEELFFYALYKFKAFWEIGTLSKNACTKIRYITGLRLDKFKLILRTNELKHFLYSHYSEKRLGIRDLKFSDINKFDDIINNLSSVDFGNKKDTLIFTKKYPDGILELVVTIDYEHKTLSGKSMRIKN